MDSSHLNAKPTNVTYTHVKERCPVMKKYVEKDMGGCSLSGIMNEDGSRISSDNIVRSIAVLHERGNGLGGGFAAYGIYPEYREYYALHLMFNNERSKELTEAFVETNFLVELVERIPTRNVNSIIDPPILWRYFVRPKDKLPDAEEDDLVVQSVMKINSSIDGAFVMSSGKNMGVFKATGFPEDVAKFYKLEEYEAYTWIAHGRFPTNTPGWCGGAHPFSLLDWSVAHNGEISSYGTNKRYLEMFGYVCTLMTDTEVMTYLFDLLVRRHHLPIEIVSLALASPLWYDIDRMQPERRELCKAIRAVYGSTLVNGPFAIILGYREGMVGLNDRIKLRPLVAARKKNTLYLASEESGIREICKGPDEVWFPKAGEPVIGRLREPVHC
jgi:glutamate synthase domain-containing protein 1